MIGESVLGSSWKSRLSHSEVMHPSKFDAQAFVRDIILARGVLPDNVDSFVSPSIKALLPNPFHLLDMNKAVDRVVSAIENGETIAVFADYDVDGATSSAVLCNYLHEIGVSSFVYVPDRIEEGYGPNSNAMLKLKDRGASLCITVDCGIVAHEPIAVASRAGLDIIVIDHHISSTILPEAVAIVNPNRYDETSPCKHVAAVGVVFLFLVALNSRLRELGYFKKTVEPNLMMSLDLVAIGTICDMVPLTGLNRAFVSRGLKVLNNSRNIGLRSLINRLDITSDVTVYDIGFKIGPCINAGGRIGDANLGACLFMSKNLQECAAIASKLHSLNEERKQIHETSLSEAMVQAEIQALRKQNFITVVGKWHPGVIGILASKIKDALHLPVVVISTCGEIPKASARSVSPVDIGSLVLEAKYKKLVIEGGGHFSAAGFSVEPNNINIVHEFMLEKTNGVVIERIKEFDSAINPELINIPLLEAISQMAPFGMGNPTPKFVILRPKIANSTLIKGKHLACNVIGPGVSIPSMCFDAGKSRLGDAITAGNVKAILVTVSRHYRQQEQAQIIIEDVMQD